MPTHYTPISTGTGIANTADVFNSRYQELDDAIVDLDTSVATLDTSVTTLESEMAALTVATPVKLSGSTDGRQIKVAATATPGTLIHTSTTPAQHVWLWIYNGDTVPREITFEWGGVSAPDDNIKISIPSKAGKPLIIPGLLLQGAYVIRAFGAAANVLMVGGYALAAASTIIPLSGSDNGRGVKVVATSSPGTTIHTAHATMKDAIYLWAYNSDTVARILTLQFGGTSTPDDDIVQTIAPKTGLYLAIDGELLTNSLLLKAYADAANVVTVLGYVNRRN